jgi:carboxymethylenebutenolidase
MQGCHARISFMLSTIAITAPDGAGAVPADLLRPAAPRPGVVVLLHEIFGVNDNLRATAEGVVARGHAALLPDLFWRQAAGTSLDPDAGMPAWERAFALMRGLDEARAVADLRAVIAAARDLPGTNGRVATMGFCLGGRLAWLMATAGEGDAHIAYYPVGVEDRLAGVAAIRSPVMLHLARRDRFVPEAAQRTIAGALAGHARAEVHLYEADHAFARAGARSFDAAAAAVAQARSAALLARVLG